MKNAAHKRKAKKKIVIKEKNNPTQPNRSAVGLGWRKKDCNTTQHASRVVLEKDGSDPSVSGNSIK